MNGDNMDGSAVGSGMIAEDTLLGVIDTLGGGVIVLDIDLKIVAANTHADQGAWYETVARRG